MLKTLNFKYIVIKIFLSAVCISLVFFLPIATGETEPNKKVPDTTQLLQPEEINKKINSIPVEKKVADIPLEAIKTFANVFQKIKNTYIKDISDTDLMQKAIEGMLALDPHSEYLDAKEMNDLTKLASGTFSGIGIYSIVSDGEIKVISSIDGSPASKAGIKSGDLIISIDGIDVKQLTAKQCNNKLQGEKGTQVKLKVMRKKATKPLYFSLTREEINTPSVYSKDLGNGLVYTRISRFHTDTSRELFKQITAFKSKKDGIQGLILDLRNNGGGLLQAGVDVADYFIDNGLIVYTQGKSPVSREKFISTNSDIIQDQPMIVLINEGSASSSEIVAGALQDHKRALLLGTKSFGKGSIQTVNTLNETKGDGFKLTIALYYTPNGRSIQAEGIIPNLIVPQIDLTIANNQEDHTRREKDLAGHLNNQQQKSTKKSKLKKDGTPDQEWIEKDHQLSQAINALKVMRFTEPPKILENKKVTKASVNKSS